MNEIIFDLTKNIEMHLLILPNTNEKFMEPYCRELDEKKMELRTEVFKWATEMEKVYNVRVSKCNSDDAMILSYHVVKEFVLQDLGGLKKFKFAEEI